MEQGKASGEPNILTHESSTEAPMSLPDEYERTAVFQLFRDGLDNARISKAVFSQHAYRDFISGLEDADANGQRAFILMDHQREALGWWRETTKKHHCFLFADDMGLGKTIVAIARIKLELDEAASQKRAAKFLVVVPNFLVSFWTKEFGRCPSIKICVQDGSQTQECTEQQLSTHDVILTTFGHVKSQYIELKHAIEKSSSGSVDGTNELRQLPSSFLVLSTNYFEIIVDGHAKDAAQVDALCYIKADNRVVMTAMPYLYGCAGLFSLFRILQFAPLDCERTFKTCFIGKLKQESNSLKTENDADQELIAIAILAAIQLQRLKSDHFEGKPIINVPPQRAVHHVIKLSPDAQATQEATRFLWDGDRMKKEPDSARVNVARTASGEEKKRISQQIHEARVNAIHPMLATAGYGDYGELELEGQDEDDLDVNMLLQGRRNI